MIAAFDFYGLSIAIAWLREDCFCVSHPSLAVGANNVTRFRVVARFAFWGVIAAATTFDYRIVIHGM